MKLKICHVRNFSESLALPIKPRNLRTEHGGKARPCRIGCEQRTALGCELPGAAHEVPGACGQDAGPNGGQPLTLRAEEDAAPAGIPCEVRTENRGMLACCGFGFGGVFFDVVGKNDRVDDRDVSIKCSPDNWERDSRWLPVREFEAAVVAAIRLAQHRADNAARGHRADRLADFRARFLELLNGSTVRNLSHLTTDLRRARSDIERRMEFINKSLERSPFNGERTVRIDVKDARGQVVQDFQRDLDAATSHSLGEFGSDDTETALARYHALDKILSRLGSSQPEDLRWRNVVLDTRRHVSFIGRELYPDGTTANTYQDSASLSGGQAQKLVFFCLALIHI